MIIYINLLYYFLKIVKKIILNKTDPSRSKLYRGVFFYNINLQVFNHKLRGLNMDGIGAIIGGENLKRVLKTRSGNPSFYKRPFGSYSEKSVGEETEDEKLQKAKDRYQQQYKKMSIY